MKKLVLSLFVVSALGTSAQNILDQKITFKYTQLPLMKIHDGSKTFAVDVQMAYKQRNDDSLKAYEQAKQNYASQLDIYMDAWEQEKLKVDRQHLTNLVLWESQVAAGNTTATKPVKAPYPAFNAPGRPKKPFLLQEVQAASVIAAVRIEGMNQNTSSTTKITLQFEGFEKGIIKQETKGTAPAVKYEYTVQYRHPVTIKVEVPGKGIVVNQRIAETEGFRIWKTKEFKSKSEFDLWWMDNESLVWEERQRQVVFENMEVLNNWMTNQYGYPVRSRKVEVYSVKDKDMDYSDYQKAFTIMESGLLMLAYPDKIAEAQKKIGEAIAIWNNALKESDLVNKKARVDKWVTSATYINLAEAAIWMGDYDNAEMYANKANNVGVNKYERDARALIEFARDQRNRSASK